MTKDKIKLGDKVKDLVSGYTGIATLRTKFMNGCTQYGVIGKFKQGQPAESILGGIGIDQDSLVVVKKKAVMSKEYEEEEEKEDEYEDENEEEEPNGGQ